MANRCSPPFSSLMCFSSAGNHSQHQQNNTDEMCSQCEASAWCGDGFWVLQDLRWHAHKHCRAMRPFFLKNQSQALGFDALQFRFRFVCTWRLAGSAEVKAIDFLLMKCLLTIQCCCVSVSLLPTRSSQTPTVTSRQSHENICTWTYILCKHSKLPHTLT